MNCSPGVLSNVGTVYQHTFANAGSYSYHCLSHCLLGMTGVVNVSGGCAPVGMVGGSKHATVRGRVVGVYFPANGKFYAMGGRSSDTAGSDFAHPFEYDPGSNSWTTKSATYPDNQVNNMACGVLADRNPLHLLRGRLGRRRNDGYRSRLPIRPCHGTHQPGCCSLAARRENILPGGFTVFQNKLYILGGFDIQRGRDQPDLGVYPSQHAGYRRAAVLPVPRGYIPTTTIGSFIYTGGGSDITGGAITDTTNSFVYNPVADTIGTIASIPRATGETRGLNFNGKMYVMGGGRIAPNPSNEVDVYDPGPTAGHMGLPFMTARRNFPTDTDGTTTFGWQAAMIAYRAHGFDGNLLQGGERQRQHRPQQQPLLLRQRRRPPDLQRRHQRLLRRRRPPRHLQRRHYHQEFDLRQHRGLGQHHRLAHNGCSRFAACHAEAPRRRVRSASHDCKCG